MHHPEKPLPADADEGARPFPTQTDLGVYERDDLDFRKFLNTYKTSDLTDEAAFTMTPKERTA